MHGIAAAVLGVQKGPHVDWPVLPPSLSTTHPPLHTHNISVVLQELLRNLWVLAIMAGVVAIVVVAKGRIHVPEPLAGVHATDGVVPFVLPLDATSM